MAESEHGRSISSNGALGEAGRALRALVVLVGMVAFVVLLRFAVYDYFHGGRTLAAVQEMTHS